MDLNAVGFALAMLACGACSSNSSGGMADAGTGSGGGSTGVQCPVKMCSAITAAQLSAIMGATYSSEERDQGPSGGGAPAEASTNCYFPIVNPDASTEIYDNDVSVTLDCGYVPTSFADIFPTDAGQRSVPGLGNGAIIVQSGTGAELRVLLSGSLYLDVTVDVALQSLATNEAEATKIAKAVVAALP